MPLDLPAPVAAFRDRVNAGDTDGVLALFPSDGVVIDWGRRFAGHAAIRGWSDKELVGAKGTLTITGVVSADAQRAVVDTQWASSFFTGPGRYAGGWTDPADGDFGELIRPTILPSPRSHPGAGRGPS